MIDERTRTIDRLLEAAHDPTVLVSIGIPERLGDACWGVEVGAWRIAVIERWELAAVVAALPSGQLKAALCALPEVADDDG